MSNMKQGLRRRRVLKLKLFQWKCEIVVVMYHAIRCTGKVLVIK